MRKLETDANTKCSRKRAVQQLSRHFETITPREK